MGGERHEGSLEGRPMDEFSVLRHARIRCLPDRLGHPFTINELANRQSLYLLLDNPELFTSIGIADGTIFDHHSGRLAAVGKAKRDHDYAEQQKDLDEVRKFDPAKLKGQDRITYDVLVDFYSAPLALQNSTGSHPKGCIPSAPSSAPRRSF
jgi:hypothetical protein